VARKKKRTKEANGDGSISERKDRPEGSGTRWMGRITSEYRAGKQTRITVYGRTKDEVKDKLAAKGALIKKGVTLPTGKPPTLAQFYPVWLEATARRSKPSTVRRYRSLFEGHILETLGKVALNKLDAGHVEDLLDAKAKEPVRGHTPTSPKLMSLSTQLHIRDALRACLSYAASPRHGWIIRNAAADAEVAKKPPTPAREVLTREGAAQLVHSAEGKDDGPIWVLAITTGARLGELLALSWEDVNLDTRSATIRHTLARVDGQYVLGTPKNNKARAVNLSSAAVDTLNAQHAQQAKARLAAGSKWDNPWDLVFTTATGSPRNGSVVSHRFKAHALAERLPVRVGDKEREARTLRFHDLRHSAATFWIAKAPPREVSQALGHYSVAFTLDAYGGTTQAGADKLVEAMDAITG
jgi:integrase